jgi:hypothetical protein
MIRLMDFEPRPSGAIRAEKLPKRARHPHPELQASSIQAFRCDHLAMYKTGSFVTSTL